MDKNILLRVVPVRFPLTRNSHHLVYARQAPAANAVYAQEIAAAVILCRRSPTQCANLQGDLDHLYGQVCCRQPGGVDDGRDKRACRLQDLKAARGAKSRRASSFSTYCGGWVPGGSGTGRRGGAIPRLRCSRCMARRSSQSSAAVELLQAVAFASKVLPPTEIWPLSAKTIAGRHPPLCRGQRR